MKPCAPGLPDVQEHPMERQEMVGSTNARISFERILQEHANTDGLRKSDTAQEVTPGESSTYAGAPNPYRLDIALADCFARDNGANESGLKRRRSGGSTINSLTKGVITRLPSLSKRKGRKQASMSRSEGNSGVSSPVQPRSRSNSRARSRSLFRRSDVPEVEPAGSESLTMSGRFETIEEIEQDDPASGLQPFRPSSNHEVDPERLTFERVQTPLLPALMESRPQKDASTPVEPIKLVDSPFGEIHYDPTNSIQATPQLSAQNSSTVLRQGYQRSENQMSINTSPSGLPDNEWSDRLGHANFVISPEPYLPDHFNPETCSALLADWNKARSEFSKHLARTNKNFGHESRTYRLTEEKWSEIDSEWKRYYDEARCAVPMSEGSLPTSPTEPLPVVKIPSLDDEKFPQLWDYEIVGPMERIAPPEPAPTPFKRTASKTAGLMKLFGGLNKRARSASGPEGFRPEL